MGLDEHRAAAPTGIAIFAITLSDTREEADDAGGAALRAAFTGAGHVVLGWRIVREDEAAMRAALDAALALAGCDVLVLTGGTGIAPRDRAYDVLATVYDRPLPGFGELFRSLSFAEIGSAALLSRASAGVARGKLVFSIPGSRGAVRLALERLILPEIGHLVGELRRDPGTREERR
jgi:molybdenum cofactor biosynthesis protein B